MKILIIMKLMKIKILINNENNENLTNTENSENDNYNSEDDSDYYVRNDKEVIIEPLIESIQSKLCRREDVFTSLTKYNFELYHFSSFIETIAKKDDMVTEEFLYALRKSNIAVIACIGAVNDEGDYVDDVKGYNDIKIIYSPDGENVIDLQMPSINIMTDFVNEVKFEGKRKCDICYNKEFKRCGYAATARNEPVLHVTLKFKIVKYVHTAGIHSKIMLIR
jgi:hypothetical protein